MSTKRNLATGVAAVGLAFGLPAGTQAQQGSDQDPSSQVVLNPGEVTGGCKHQARCEWHGVPVLCLRSGAAAQGPDGC